MKSRIGMGGRTTILSILSMPNCLLEMSPFWGIRSKLGGKKRKLGFSSMMWAEAESCCLSGFVPDS